MAAQPAFFAHSLHQPLGLMTPSTCLQALGGMNLLQPSHCWLPFGES